MTNFIEGPERRTFSWPVLLLAWFCGALLSTQAALGSPILVLTNAADPFSQYYQQIILTEGLNEYALSDVSSVTNGTLAQYDVAILAQTDLTPTQVTAISSWVNGGVS